MSGHAADGLVDLVDRARDREPEQKSERSDHSEVVQRDAKRARDAMLGESVDARAHRGREDEAEEDEREHDLQLPERKCERDHGHGDDGRDKGFASGVGHSKAVLAGLRRPQTQEWRRIRRSGSRDARHDEAGLLRRTPPRRRARAPARAGSAAGRCSARVLLASRGRCRVPGAALVVVAAAVCLRAVWRWERTQLVVTTEKVCLVDGTLRRRASAVRLRSVEHLELEQSLPGRLFGYGTLVAGPLEIEPCAATRAASIRLVERLAG